MIRQAVPAEAAAVHALVRAAYQRYVPVIGVEPAPMTDDYAARIAAQQVWVLVEDAALAGVLVLEERADCFLLDNIAIAPDRQGLGHGRTLLDFAEAQAWRAGWNAITLYTNARMTENIAIYQARGYQLRDRRVEKGFDRVYMVKPLAT
ncbi:GNAT family N-acetyltransferase [Rhodopila sp.]|jgi:GNAT superfamily N-acetyltransferase|uniref:GNAT family N-acetyltransferase n=1 Tax=Rhodopila sp. TaxID=2480087 RepID=UPI002BC7D2F5|nr:GNAT family N-acetyltransferase [Rhodopila sp.]HVZ09599.1 GNAT family N-acetyltransferase [Rhodopila sp.]